MRNATLPIFLLPALGLADTPRKECFPLERLPATLRHRAEALLLKLLDGESLFTIVGGMKPMSSGWLEFETSVEKPEVAKLEELRKILSTFRSGDDIGATLQPFHKVYDGRRSLTGVIYHRASFSKKMSQESAFFGYFGLSPASPPPESILAFEADSTPRRNRAYGYLFGYPSYAVDFFVEAVEKERTEGASVARDFFSVPVFAGSDHRFVWAIPKGASPRSEDLAIREQAAPILAYYALMRAKYVGPGKRGVVALLRDWMDDGTGRCSPETALRKARGVK